MLNELVNTSSVLSKEMNIKFSNDLRIIDEMRKIRDKLFENDRKVEYFGLKLKQLVDIEVGKMNEVKGVANPFLTKSTGEKFLNFMLVLASWMRQFRDKKSKKKSKTNSKQPPFSSSRPNPPP